MSKLFETIHLGQKILHFNVPIEIVDEINLTYQNNVKDLKEHNHFLAGKIKDEHRIDNLLSKEVKRYFKNCFRVYLIECKEMYNINLVSAWVNEMKEHEYNPAHIHRGMLYTGLSSVMILKLPSSYGREYSNAEVPQNGRLQILGAANGQFAKIDYQPPMDLRDFYVFPYDMRHTVYPFNGTNEIRRTLAANCDVSFDPIKNRGAL